MLLISMGPGLTSTSLNYMASAKLFIKEETRHVACIFISITMSTRKGVKKQTYPSAIGRSHRTFGESWRRRKRWRNKVEERGRMRKKAKQQLLDFKKVTGPCKFTRASVLHAVANLIATNNQVSC